jgi:hypothetical protein
MLKTRKIEKGKNRIKVGRKEGNAEPERRVGMGVDGTRGEYN